MTGTLSRRALLLGRGLGRPAEPAPAWSPHRLAGHRVEPAAEALVRASAAGPGRRVLVIGPAEDRVAMAGADVVAVDLAPMLPVADAAFDCVLSNFTVIHARDSRRIVDELERVLVAGGVAAITAWASAGFMGRVLRLAGEGRGPDRPRPERWGRYEGVQLAFSRFPGFEARDESLRWQFESAAAAWNELAAPAGPLAAAARPELRERVLRLVESHARREGGRLVIDVGYLLVVARKPGG